MNVYYHFMTGFFDGMFSPGILKTAETQPPFSQKGEILLGVRAVRGGPFNTSVGRHQFLVVIPKHPRKLPSYMLRDVGDGRFGIIVGGASRSHPLLDRRELQAKLFDRTDTTAMRVAVGAEEDEHQLEPKLYPISPPYGHSYASYANRILSMVGKFKENSLANPVYYPSMGLGANSNSLIQSMLDYTQVREAPENLPGFDFGSAKRLPPAMFGLPPEAADKVRRKFEKLSDTNSTIRERLGRFASNVINPEQKLMPESPQGA